MSGRALLMWDEAVTQYDFGSEHPMDPVRLALSFPLHPPGRPERSRAEELLGTGLPTLVVQGGNDPFGRPGEFPEGPYRLVEIPYGDHGFALPKRAPLGPDDARELLVDAVAEWIVSLR